MPFRYEERTTPKGKPLLVIHATGHISFEDADELLRRVVPGGSHHDWLLITLAEKGVEYAPAARKHFYKMNEHYRALATVVTSPIVRAAINMMLRLTSNVTRFRMFTNEAEAIAWLDNY